MLETRVFDLWNGEKIDMKKTFMGKIYGFYLRYTGITVSKIKIASPAFVLALGTKHQTAAAAMKPATICISCLPVLAHVSQRIKNINFTTRKPTIKCK